MARQVFVCYRADCCASGLRFFADQQGKPRKQEVAAGVVDHIYLTGIKTGFERRERHVQLENGGLALARV